MKIPQIKIISFNDIEIWTNDFKTLLFKGNKIESDKKLEEIINEEYKDNIEEFKKDLKKFLKQKIKK